MLHHCPPKSARKLSIAAAALATVMFSTASLHAEPPRDRTVSVSASATVSVAPDMAHFQVGVTSEAPTARDALSQNNANMAKLIDGLKRAGLGASDLRTSGLALYPRYSQRKTDNVQRIDGYQASNTLRVTVRDLAKLGELLDATITLGANQIQGITFEVSKAETLRDDARRDAMVNARRRAELYATASGARVGPVLAISETIAGIAPRRVQLQAQRSSASESVPVEPGSQSLEAQVHVVFALE